MNDPFRVGLGQIPSIQGDIEHNLALMEDKVDQAVKDGVTLLVFPELALTGYVLDDRFSDLAIRLDGPIMDRLAKMSEKLDIVTGFIEETPRHIFHNSAVHLSGGEIVHVHRKIYLPTYGMFDERRYYGPGWDVAAYDTAYNMRTATLVCGDAWHLSIPYLAAHRGADLIVFVAASSTTGLAASTTCDWAWKAMCSSYALTLSSFVVFVNLANAEGDYDFWGGSFVCGPSGQTIAESATSDGDFITCDLDPAVLREQRIRLPFRRDDSLGHALEIGQMALTEKIEQDTVHSGPTPKTPRGGAK